MKKLLILFIIVPFLATAQTKPDLTYKVLEVSYIVLNTADYIITLNGLNNGLEELNPIASKMNPYAMASLKFASTASVVLLNRITYRHNPKAAKITMIGMNLIYGLVVSHNIKIILKIN